MNTLLIKDQVFNQNAYLLVKNGEAIIIDPGYGYKNIIETIEKENLKPIAILLTHYHFDHVAGVDPICEKFGIKAYINKRDHSHLIKDTGATLLRFAPITVKEENTTTFDEKIKIGDFEIKGYLAQGHSEGSTIFVWNNDVFTGDVIFYDGYGRTDLPGGNPQKMSQTLKDLKSVLTKYENIYPGHGPSFKNK